MPRAPIVRWIKKVGESVDRDEPLFEISTDKVDAEIPSPAAGVLAEIKVKEGETVAVNSVVATIGEPGAAGRPPMLGRPRRAAGRRVTVTSAPAAARPSTPARRRARIAAAGGGPAAGPEAALDQRPGRAVEGRAAARQSRRRSCARSRTSTASTSARLQGSGIGGRVTKHDILGYIEHGARRGAVRDRRRRKLRAPAGGHVPAFMAGESVEIVPMSVMRRKIAEHMVLSRRTSAHVHSVFEVNFTRVPQLRDRKKGEYERAGVKLTYMSFITKAIVDALRPCPSSTPRSTATTIVYKKDVNIGIAVALDWGLIVPVREERRREEPARPEPRHRRPRRPAPAPSS